VPVKSYNRIKFIDALRLAAPHTWVASISPVMLAGALRLSGEAGFTQFSPHPVAVFTCSLAAAVLLQSAVNTFNDCFDFARGLDRPENSDDPSDAVLVYRNVNPRSVFALGLVFMAMALLFGIPAVMSGGVRVAIIGAAGCAVVVLYSAVPSEVFGLLRRSVPDSACPVNLAHPPGTHRHLSALPLGEAVSGIVMGFGITLAVYIALSRGQGISTFALLGRSSPLIIGIALIMFTNNIFDIERDFSAGRRTLPLLLGRNRARVVFRVLCCGWLAIVFSQAFVSFRGGAVFCVAASAFAMPVMVRMFRSEMSPVAGCLAVAGTGLMNAPPAVNVANAVRDEDCQCVSPGARSAGMKSIVLLNVLLDVAWIGSIAVDAARGML